MALGEHVMEMLGKSRVVVRDGKIVDASEPMVSYCPLFFKLRGIKNITKDEVIKNVEFRMKDFGLFTERRIVEDNQIYASFGASEIFSRCLKRGFLDAVVIAADCAGTVITNNPNLVQGLGGRLSGLVKTSPVKEVMKKIERAGGVVVDEDARICQVDGVKVAVNMGYKKIGVTLTDPEDAKLCRKIERQEGVKILKFAVHTTGVDLDGERILQFDLITLCASKKLRSAIGEFAKAQAGDKIPIVAVSNFGKEALLESAKEMDGILIKIEKLPHLGDDQPSPLV